MDGGAADTTMRRPTAGADTSRGPRLLALAARAAACGAERVITAGVSAPDPGANAKGELEPPPTAVAPEALAGRRGGYRRGIAGRLAAHGDGRARRYGVATMRSRRCRRGTGADRFAQLLNPLDPVRSCGGLDPGGGAMIEPATD
jgi:hypothetical protein